MAPDFPIKRYFTRCRASASRISSACRYSNAAIPQPDGQVLLAPLSVLGHGPEGSVGGVVENRFVGADEGVPEAERQRPTRRGLKFREPIGVDRRRRVA